MSWVSIDQATCNNCGVCVLDCPRCFSKPNGQVTVSADELTCILCGHCVGRCPTSAIVHHRLDMNAFAKIESPVSFDTGTFIQFLRERRSHRLFKNQEIPLKDLETLLEVCRYSPTGSNVQNVEIILVRDRERIQKYADLTIDYFVSLEEPARRKMARLEAEGRQNSDGYAMAGRTSATALRFAELRKDNFDPILYKAPAVMIFHSITKTSMPKDNAVIASTSAALAARTMGIESCYIGLLEMAADAHPPLAEALALPPDHKVFSVMVFGYPRVKFTKVVDRRPIKVRWE